MKNLLIIIFLFLATLAIGYAQTGTLDPNYGNAGVSVTPGFARVSVQQPDGKIIVANQFGGMNVVRFMPDGSLDSAFGINGTAIFPTGSNPSPNNIIVQPDGKIIIAGEFYNNYFRMYICRLTADGAIDSSFATNGSFQHLFQATDHGNVSIHNTLDGKLLIAGTVGLSPRTPFYLKLKLDGSIDSTYGTNGVVFLTGLDFDGGVVRTRIQADGKIVTCTDYTSGGSSIIKIFKLNANGSYDNSFGASGQVNLTVPYSLGTPNIEIQPDGKIVFVCFLGISGNPTQYGTYITRFLANGNLDIGFGTSGFIVYSPISWRNVYKFDIQPSDGKIVVFGEKRLTSGGSLQEYIARFNPNGTFDTEFGEPDIVLHPSNREEFVSGHIAADGGIIAVGTSSSGSGPTATLSRVLAKYISCTNSITSQPQATSREEGTTATFTAGSSSISAVYQWQIMGATDWENLSNGGQYSGVNIATLSISNLTLSNSGAAYRTISTSGVCVDTSAPAVLTVTPSTSIAGAADLAKHFKVYPNPVKNKLLVEGSLAIQSISIIDVLGRQQLHKSINKQLQLEVDMEQFTPGVYWMQLGTTEGAATIKIIKE